MLDEHGRGPLVDENAISRRTGQHFVGHQPSWDGPFSGMPDEFDADYFVVDICRPVEYNLLSLRRARR